MYTHTRVLTGLFKHSSLYACFQGRYGHFIAAVWRKLSHAL